MLARHDPEQLLDTAISALASGPQCHAMLDELPVPIYTTDADGRLTYWNRACAEFAGHQPELGRDRWCVIWQLYTTTGEPVRREDSPMAHAIRSRRPIRDAIAIAERPDGTRRAYRPYPTPLFNDDGSLRGAINMLIDVTEEQTEALHDQAQRCRRLAEAMYDRRASAVLGTMAEGFDRTADELRADNDL
jgi:PAS domain S-box-containing protein